MLGLLDAWMMLSMIFGSISSRIAESLIGGHADEKLSSPQTQNGLNFTPLHSEFI
jgi:hypothetical protein